MMSAVRSFLACLIIALSSPSAIAVVFHATTTKACTTFSCLDGTSSSSQAFTVPPFNLLGSAAIGETPFVAWSGSAFAGGSGTVDTPFSNAGASGNAFVHWVDDIVPHSTPSWSGPGRVRFSYHITGAVDLAGSVTKPVSSTNPLAEAGVYFECGGSSGPCLSPDFAAPPPGATALINRLSYASSQAVNEVIDFDVSVHADTSFTYGIRMGPTATIGLVSGDQVPVSFTGRADANFGSTGRLVAVTLFDGSGNVVSDARFTAGSGIDYSNIAAIPEPDVIWLFVAGLGVVFYGRFAKARGQYRQNRISDIS